MAIRPRCAAHGVGKPPRGPHTAFGLDVQSSSGSLFRGRGCAKLGEADARSARLLCVWGLTPLRLTGPPGVGRQGWSYTAPARPYYTTVSVPTAGNPNLRAQEGIFLLCQHATVESRLPFEPLERVISNGMVQPRPTLIKLVLPVSEAGQLLWLLALSGIDGAVLFPGYDGVRRGIEDRQYWRRPKAEKNG